MKQTIILLLLLTSFAVVTGCSSEPKFNASKSEESVEEMAAALPEDKRELFGASLGKLTMERVLGNPAFMAVALSRNESMAKAALAGALKDLNGLTANQIIEKAGLSSEEVAEWKRKQSPRHNREEVEIAPVWTIKFSENAIDDSKEVWCRLNSVGGSVMSRPTIFLSYKNGEFRGRITDVGYHYRTVEKTVILRFGKEQPFEEVWDFGLDANIPDLITFIEELTRVNRFAFLEKDSGKSPIVFEYGSMDEVVAALKEVGAIK